MFFTPMIPYIVHFRTLRAADVWALALDVGYHIWVNPLGRWLLFGARGCIWVLLSFFFFQPVTCMYFYSLYVEGDDLLSVLLIMFCSGPMIHIKLYFFSEWDNGWSKAGWILKWIITSSVMEMGGGITKLAVLRFVWIMNPFLVHVWHKSWEFTVFF